MDEGRSSHVYRVSENGQIERVLTGTGTGVLLMTQGMKKIFGRLMKSGTYGLGCRNRTLTSSITLAEM